MSLLALVGRSLGRNCKQIHCCHNYKVKESVISHTTTTGTTPIGGLCNALLVLCFCQAAAEVTCTVMKVNDENIDKGLPLDYVYHETDVDLNSFVLIKYPIPIAVVILYLAILWLGTRWMKTRPAYQLKTVIRIYNLCQVVYNIFFLSFLIQYPQSLGVFWQVSCKYGPEDIKMLFNHTDMINEYLMSLWRFLFLKMVDLLDTIFMVLMKNNSHITFLHVYHHAGMVISTWYTFKYAKAFQAIVPGAINIFVHIIMYSYYFLSTFGRPVKKYLWWKRYLTTLQMAQFVAVFIFISLLIYKDCPVSRSFTYIWLLNVAIFLCLFIMFYINTYRNKAKPEKISKKLN